MVEEEAPASIWTRELLSRKVCDRVSSLFIFSVAGVFGYIAMWALSTGDLAAGAVAIGLPRQFGYLLWAGLTLGGLELIVVSRLKWRGVAGQTPGFCLITLCLTGSHVFNLAHETEVGRIVGFAYLPAVVCYGIYLAIIARKPPSNPH